MRLVVFFLILKNVYWGKQAHCEWNDLMHTSLQNIYFIFSYKLVIVIFEHKKNKNACQKIQTMQK